MVFLHVKSMGWSQEYKSATVLIADDDESQRELLEQALSIHRFTVIAVKDGLEAVNAFRQHRPDVVLLDVDMPLMDGFSACQLIHQEFPELAVPIIMVTGMDDVESIEKAYAVGAIDFIAKPISWPVLGHRVFYYLKGSRAVNEIKTRNEREKTLFNAIPDSVIHFDHTLTAKDIHVGKQRHLFGDVDTCTPDDSGNCISDFEHSALVMMITALLKTQHDQSGSTVNKQHFEENLLLGLNSYDVEIRIAASQHNEVIVVVRDISDRKANEQRILNLVLYDQLTGLPNRRYLEDELQRCLGRSTQPEYKVAVLFITIDHFGTVNESFGLKVGDQLLILASQRIKEGLNYLIKGDSAAHGANEGHYRLARFSQNEFTVMLTHLSDTNEAYRVGQLLQDMVIDPFAIDGHEIHISLSIGIAFYPDDSSDSGKLIEMAGQAGQLARKPGNHITCYSASFNEQAQRKFSIEKNLRKALEKNEFHLVFQPKLCVTEPENLSAEVLLRWNNDELGIVSPAEFIPIAEQNEVIIAISQWVVAESCRASARLRQEYGKEVKLAINLSPQQFTHQQNLIEFFHHHVSNVGMKPEHFELEITENVLIDDVDYTSRQLNELRKLGFSIAIDDFGTGYSSLSYLTRFNIDTLKIDQSFINTFDDPRSQKLIETLIVMGKKLNMQIVAEGVETQEQLTFLQQNQCDFVQGYIYAKPMPFDAFVAFLQK
ncbi:MAG: diguanylate cyclase (GGDEF)-like protein [Alteromonadaceae bacterium]|jgi:diguanylate cyclase (GGDEF)-like protein